MSSATFQFQGEEIRFAEIARRLRDYATLGTRDPDKAPRLSAVACYAIEDLLTQRDELLSALRGVEHYVDVLHEYYPASDKYARADFAAAHKAMHAALLKANHTPSPVSTEEQMKP